MTGTANGINPVPNGTDRPAIGMSARLADAHIHLDQYEAPDREAMLKRFAGCGGAAVVAVSTNKRSSEATREIAKRHAGLVHPAYGYHPEQPVPSDDEADELLEWIRERAAAGEAFAIGEVGLPYYTRQEAAEAGEPFDETPYLRLLERFAKLAAELDRPLVLHAVYEDGAKACAIAERYGVRRVHFHWFKGDEETVNRMIRAGYYVSITPDVAYEPDIQELVRRYTLELMMSETDGPWPFEGPYAGRMTEPAMAEDVVREIARLKGQPASQVQSVLFENAIRFYGLQRSSV